MSRRRGLSLLLECLIGIGIFAVAMLMAMGLYPASHNSMTHAKELTWAGELAHQVMEQQLSKPYDDIVDVAASADTRVAYTGVYNGRQVATEYIYDVAVGSKAGTELRTLLVTVRWNHGPHDRSVVLECYKAKY
jgi:hypothetical protein